MVTRTSQPARCKPRSTSMALYAAIPPVMPSATRRPENSCSAWLLMLKLKCNIAELPVQYREIEVRVQSRTITTSRNRLSEIK